MARQERIRSRSGYYHIMIRGNERKFIFNDDEDKLRFIETISERKNRERFKLHAFCLMDNHVHLMLSEGTENISNTMKRITVSYVYYFNKKYNRIGHLFQDRYKSEVVEDDNYVLALARYIHRNPVKAGIAKAPEEYRWSSYTCYINEEQYFNKILDKEILLALFSGNKKEAEKRYIEYMNDVTEYEFIDIQEEKQYINEKEAKQIFEQTLQEVRDIKETIKKYKRMTNLSIRQIASISGLNKDKVNRMLKEE